MSAIRTVYKDHKVSPPVARSGSGRSSPPPVSRPPPRAPQVTKQGKQTKRMYLTVKVTATGGSGEGPTLDILCDSAAESSRVTPDLAFTQLECPVHRTKSIRTAMGATSRETVLLTLVCEGRELEVEATVSDSDHHLLGLDVLVGYSVTMQF